MSSLCLMLIKSSWLNSSSELAFLTLGLSTHPQFSKSDLIEVIEVMMSSYVNLSLLCHFIFFLYFHSLLVILLQLHLSPHSILLVYNVMLFTRIQSLTLSPRCVISCSDLFMYLPSLQHLVLVGLSVILSSLSQCLLLLYLSQTSFGHISTKSSTIPTVSKPA